MADYIKLLAFSGARRTAGLTARWNQVDWKNRQLTLYTKYDKTVVVDFNEKLEAHLKDMFGRRDQKSQWLFPSPRKPGAHFANPQKFVELLADKTGVPFHLHLLRHYFASHAVMAGVDTITVAAMLGHSDGGVLVSKVYSHLSAEHKRHSAAKINFTEKAASAVPLAPTPDLSGYSVEELLALVQKKIAQPKAAPQFLVFGPPA